MTAVRESSILDLGCGLRRQPGAVGVDRDPACRPDVLHDLDDYPWPLPEDRFEEIRCSHILEHLGEIERAMREIHRVARPGARVVIVTPHFSSVNSWDDPTHLHHLSSASFDRYCGPGGGGVGPGRVETAGGGRPLFRMIRKDLGFGGSLLNCFPRGIARRSLRWYEKHVAFILPARNLTFELEVRKT